MDTLAPFFCKRLFGICRFHLFLFLSFSPSVQVLLLAVPYLLFSSLLVKLFLLYKDLRLPVCHWKERAFKTKRLWFLDWVFYYIQHQLLLRLRQLLLFEASQFLLEATNFCFYVLCSCFTWNTLGSIYKQSEVRKIYNIIIGIIQTCVCVPVPFHLNFHVFLIFVDFDFSRLYFIKVMKKIFCCCLRASTSLPQLFLSFHYGLLSRYSEFLLT